MRLAYVGFSIASFGILVGTIVVHLAFAGGQVGALDGALWPSLLAWPVLAVPASVVIGIAIVGSALGVAVAAMASVRNVAELPWLAAIAIAFVATPLFTGGWFPDARGIEMPWFEDGFRMGWHAVGAPFGVVAHVALRIRRVTLLRARARTVREGR